MIIFVATYGYNWQRNIVLTLLLIDNFIYVNG